MTHADLRAREARIIARKMRLKAERRSTAAAQIEHQKLILKMLRLERRMERRAA